MLVERAVKKRLSGLDKNFSFLIQGELKEFRHISTTMTVFAFLENFMLFQFFDAFQIKMSKRL